jgi:hypothetical protein
MTDTTNEVLHYTQVLCEVLRENYRQYSIDSHRYYITKGENVEYHQKQIDKLSKDIVLIQKHIEQLTDKISDKTTVASRSTKLITLQSKFEDNVRMTLDNFGNENVAPTGNYPGKDVRLTQKGTFINNNNTSTIAGNVVQEKQALSKALKPKADN